MHPTNSASRSAPHSAARTAGSETGGEAIRLLVVEDSELDYELLLRSLRRQHFDPHAVRVEEAGGLQAALANGPWDAVISDHHLPRFSSTEALRIIRSEGENLPFIIVSGNIGEDAAVAAIQAGADDYLIKGRLARLGPALRSAMSAGAARRERSAAQEALAASEQRLRALTDHLQQAVEAERADIAREVHDDVGGMLTALRFDLSWIERHGDVAIRDRAHQGLETLNQAVEAVHRIMRIDTHLDCNRERIDVSEQVAITVYRVAQESLTNIGKHSQAAHARLDLVVQDDMLSLEISDDGVGISQADLDKPGSFGLRGLTERARQANGWLEIAAGKSKGAIMLMIPLTPEAAARLESEPDA